MTEEIYTSTTRRTCGICFGAIEKGEQFTYAPFGRSQLAVVSVHPKCTKKEAGTRKKDTP